MPPNVAYAASRSGWLRSRQAGAGRAEGEGPRRPERRRVRPRQPLLHGRRLRAHEDDMESRPPCAAFACERLPRAQGGSLRAGLGESVHVVQYEDRAPGPGTPARLERDVQVPREPAARSRPTSAARRGSSDRGERRPLLRIGQGRDPVVDGTRSPPSLRVRRAWCRSPAAPTRRWTSGPCSVERRAKGPSSRLRPRMGMRKAAFKLSNKKISVR